MTNGSRLDLAGFLRTYGPEAQRWPHEACHCPGCGAQMIPQLFRAVAQSFAAAHEIVSRDVKATPGQFAHAEQSAQSAAACPTSLQTLQMADRFPYVFDLDLDFRMRDQVESALQDPVTRARNDETLRALFFGKGPDGCFAHPHAKKLMSLTVLADRPAAFPLLLAVLSDPFTYNARSGKAVKARYRTDNERAAKGKGDYISYDGEIIEGYMPKHVVMCFADSMKPIEGEKSPVKRIGFPEMNPTVRTGVKRTKFSSTSVRDFAAF
jgi:hypothetical protein